MLTNPALNILLAIVMVSLITGCKIAVMVVEGGMVGDGEYNLSTCTEGEICILEVDYSGYSETFSAIPKPGWRFVKWNAGNDFLCGNSTVPFCTLPDISANEISEHIVASSRTFYLMPLFAPLTKIGTTVTMNGKAWAPMTSFGDLSWDEINAVCPTTNGGRCLAGGKLMAYDMTGWTWASVEDVNALITTLATNGTIGPLHHSIAGLEFNRAGFPPTTAIHGCAGCFYYTWKGWTSTASGIPGQPHLAEVYYETVITDIDAHENTLLTDDSSAGHSAWFYRTSWSARAARLSGSDIPR